MEKDMTKGSPFRLILAFTVPLIIGNVFQQLYNMVDAIIVGRTVGVNALAAVGMSGSIVFLILGFLNGLTTGFTVLTSRTFGAGNLDGMKRSVYSSSVLAVVVTVILTIISVTGLKGLLHLMNTPEEIYQDAYQYLFVVFLGIWTQVLYNLLASFLRALGNSTPVFSDPGGSAEYLPGFVLYSGAADGNKRRGSGYCDLTGSFRYSVSCVHSEEGAASAHEKGAQGPGEKLRPFSDQGGNSHGTSVLYHSSWHHDPAERAQWFRSKGSGRIHCVH